MPQDLEPTYCDHYWGSHGCDLAPGHHLHDEQVHQCSTVEHIDENAHLGVRFVCSEMKVLDDTGRCLVRFQYLDHSGWSDWDDTWKWFSNSGLHGDWYSRINLDEVPGG